MLMTRFSPKKLFLTLFCVAVFTVALAMPGYWKSFRSYYNIKKGSNLSKEECGICHIRKGEREWNGYGRDIKKLLDRQGTTRITPEIFRAVESLDSDGDGYSNIDEIKADTLPGDPKSHP